MPDLKPPRLAGNERDTLTALLGYHRESIVRKLDGLSRDEATRRFVPTDTTLLWLVKHLTRAEAMWVLERFAGLDVTIPDAAITADDTVAGVIEEYRATTARTDAVVAASDLDAVCRHPDVRDPPVNLRWVLTHLLEETARHAGHADILREMTDGATGR